MATWSMPGTKKQDFEEWMNSLKSRLADGVDTAAGHIVDNFHIFDYLKKVQISRRLNKSILLETLANLLISYFNNPTRYPFKALYT